MAVVNNDMLNKKRGQAAMEFLMTYGWALLVVLIALGALAYFGLLNPGKALPDSCFLGPGLHCKEFKVDTTGIRMSVTNSLGKDIDEFVVTIGGSSFSETCVGQSGFARVKLLDTYFPKTGSSASDPPIDVFKNGQTLPITVVSPLVSSGGGTATGYFCGNDQIVLPSDRAGTAICCILINDYYSTSTIFCPDGFDDGSQSQGICKSSETIWLNALQGSKFERDLIIVYKTVGSAIYHKREGSVKTIVE